MIPGKLRSVIANGNTAVNMIRFSLIDADTTDSIKELLIAWEQLTASIAFLCGDTEEVPDLDAIARERNSIFQSMRSNDD